MSRIKNSFAPKHVQWVHDRALNWPVHNLHILLCLKSSHFTCCVVPSNALDIHQVYSKDACRPRKHTIGEKPNVALTVEGSMQRYRFTPPTMVDGIPNYDWRPWLPSMGCMHASISLSLTISRARSQVWNSVKQDSSLKTQFFLVPPCVRSSPHMAASPLIQGQSGTPDGTDSQQLNACLRCS